MPSETFPVVHPPTRVPGTTFGGAGTSVPVAGSVSNAVEVGARVTNAQLCAAGHHAWVPWLRLGTAWLTWCVREGCDHSEQYDEPGDGAMSGEPCVFCDIIEGRSMAERVLNAIAAADPAGGAET